MAERRAAISLRMNREMTWDSECDVNICEIVDEEMNGLLWFFGSRKIDIDIDIYIDIVLCSI